MTYTNYVDNKTETQMLVESFQKLDAQQKRLLLSQVGMTHVFFKNKLENSPGSFQVSQARTIIKFFKTYGVNLNWEMFK